MYCNSKGRRSKENGSKLIYITEENKIVLEKLSSLENSRDKLSEEIRVEKKKLKTLVIEDDDE